MFASHFNSIFKFSQTNQVTVNEPQNTIGIYRSDDMKLITIFIII